MKQKSTDALDTDLRYLRYLSQPRKFLNYSDFLEVMSAWFGNIRNLYIKPSERMFEIPETFAKRLQEDSLARNEAVLGNTEIPSTSKGLTFHLEPEPAAPKKMKSDDLRSENADDEYDDSRITAGPGDKLCEDELTMIFSNTWLSTQDLLNFRLVSKRWRDAATTTLRRRDACVVELRANSYFHPPSVYKNNAKHMDKNKLSQLTELISMSPEFPATDFCIHILRMNFLPHPCFPDLLDFFKLHGDKIKTLRLCGRITGKLLLDILLYVPDLKGLDLSKTEIYDGGKENALNWTFITPSLESVNIGLLDFLCQQHKPEFFRLLLSFLSKLSFIENVTLETLQIILTEGKGHLIRSFKYLLRDARFTPASQLTKFGSLNPKLKLSKVTLDFQGHCPSSATINSLNEFIESYKDTVQTFELLCHYHQHAWDGLLNIPPMKNVKSLTLKLGTMCQDHVVPDCRVCQAEVSKHFIGIRGTLFKFQDGISAQNYFPSLIKVRLHSSLSKFNQVSPMSFFSFESHTDDGPPSKSGFFPKVDVLEINRMDVESRYGPAVTCHPPTETSLIAEVFPNIRILKFQCGQVSNLSSDLWTLCRDVEFMEIYGIASCWSGGRGVEMSRFVDKVFTGSSDRMLRRLRRSAARDPCDADDSEDFKLEPRLSDLRRLRELKLKFAGKWSTEFASSITGVHAFSKMENTKFIISYDHARSRKV